MKTIFLLSLRGLGPKSAGRITCLHICCCHTSAPSVIDTQSLVTCPSFVYMSPPGAPKGSLSTFGPEWEILSDQWWPKWEELPQSQRMIHTICYGFKIKFWVVFSREIKWLAVFAIWKAHSLRLSVALSYQPLCLLPYLSLQAIPLICTKNEGQYPNMWPIYCKIPGAAEKIPGVFDKLALS